MKLRQLRIIRTQNKLTQQQIADVLGVSRSTYCSYESGRRSIDVSTLAQLSAFYHLPMDRFVGDIVESYVYDSTYYEEQTDKRYLSELSQKERELIVKFRIMNENDKKKLLKSISKIENNNK